MYENFRGPLAVMCETEMIGHLLDEIAVYCEQRHDHVALTFQERVNYNKLAAKLRRLAEDALAEGL